MNKELKLLLHVRLQKKVEGGPVQWWGRGQSGCERRIEVIVKMQNKKKGWGGVLFEGGGGGQKNSSYCENARKKSEGGEWPELMDVTKELKIEVRIDVTKN